MLRRDQRHLPDRKTGVERSERDRDVDAVVVGEGTEIELLEQRPVQQHVAGERLPDSRAARSRRPTGWRDSWWCCPGLVAGDHNGSTSEWQVVLGRVEHAAEVARVVPAEIGVDEEQEVDAVLERLVHEQLHVRAFAHSRARAIATPLEGSGSAAP